MQSLFLNVYKKFIPTTTSNMYKEDSYNNEFYFLRMSLKLLQDN